MAVSGAVIQPNAVWIGLIAVILIAIYFIYKSLYEPRDKTIHPIKVNTETESNVGAPNG